MTHEERIAELLESHDRLRAAVLLAGRYLARLPKTPARNKLLEQLREVVKQASLVRHGPKKSTDGSKAASA